MQPPIKIAVGDAIFSLSRTEALQLFSQLKTDLGFENVVLYIAPLGGVTTQIPIQ